MLIHIPTPFVLPILLIACAGVVGAATLAQRNRDLEADLSRLSASNAGTAGRERQLEATIARQHQALQKAQGEMDTLRFQVDAVELQLDGIDYLSNVLRDELGLPAGSGTWREESPQAPPQGGRYVATTADQSRLQLIQRRLAAGLAELYGLQSHARARRAAPPAGARAAPAADPWPSNWPALGPVTSRFGWRIFGGRPNFHTGTDIAMSYRSQVMATGSGTVVGSGWQPGYGWCVLIQHADGYNTLYAHLAEPLVDVGATVRPGDLIGLSGSSGMSTGPHLHYEVWKDGQLLDPQPFIDGVGPR